MLALFLLRWSKLNSVDFIGYLFYYFKLCMLDIKYFAIHFNCLSPFVLWEWWFHNMKLHEFTVHNLRALWHSNHTESLNLYYFLCSNIQQTICCENFSLSLSKTWLKRFVTIICVFLVKCKVKWITLKNSS